MAKNKTKKIIHAGALVVEAIYPRVTVKDSNKVRAAKKKASSEAQKRMNRIYSYQKLELLLAANFVPGDLVITLTCDNDHLPTTKKEAVSQLKYFRQKLSAMRKKKGQELVAVWCTEHKHGDGRWHHHMVINATGDDFDAIRKLWIYGDNVEITKLRIEGDKNYESLARYMAKEEPEKLGQRSWSYTRNCNKPEIETFRVEDDTQIQAPSGATVLSEVSERTADSYYKIIKYLEPWWQHSKPKSKGRRRRK